MYLATQSFGHLGTPKALGHFGTRDTIFSRLSDYITKSVLPDNDFFSSSKMLLLEIFNFVWNNQSGCLALNRNSRAEVFCEKDVNNYFSKFIGKRMCLQPTNLSKRDSNTTVFL